MWGPEFDPHVKIKMPGRQHCIPVIQPMGDKERSDPELNRNSNQTNQLSEFQVSKRLCLTNKMEGPLVSVSGLPGHWHCHMHRHRWACVCVHTLEVTKGCSFSLQ